jgi:hypothetical protein
MGLLGPRLRYNGTPYPLSMQYAAGLLIATSAAGCGAEGDPFAAEYDPGGSCAVMQENEPIIGGHGAPTLFGLTAAQSKSIAAVTLPSRAGPGGIATCTGIVLADGIVLTARHCVDQDDDGRWDSVGGLAPTATISLGVPGDRSVLSGPVEKVEIHESLDVALLSAAWLKLQNSGIQPVPLAAEAVSQSWVGEPVELSGWGQSEFIEPPTLRSAIEPIVRVESEHVVVHGAHRTGACVGDSGGPLFGRGNDGSVRVIGVLDYGDASCMDEDFYTRTDILLAWEPLAELERPTTAHMECEGLKTAGTCVRGLAMWCESGTRRVADCEATGRVCGWHRDARGFRCVAPDGDPCTGLGSYAHCEDNRVVACRDGMIVGSACDKCGNVCTSWLNAGGAGCADAY